jgi:hypothetical protein
VRHTLHTIRGLNIALLHQWKRLVFALFRPLLTQFHWCLNRFDQIEIAGRGAADGSNYRRSGGGRGARVHAIIPVTQEGDANDAIHLEAAAYCGKFTGKYEHRLITGGVGHNLPQEAPRAFAQAVIDVNAMA